MEFLPLVLSCNKIRVLRYKNFAQQSPIVSEKNMKTLHMRGGVLDNTSRTVPYLVTAGEPTLTFECGLTISIGFFNGVRTRGIRLLAIGCSVIAVGENTGAV